jgi:integrase
LKSIDGDQLWSALLGFLSKPFERSFRRARNVKLDGIIITCAHGAKRSSQTRLHDARHSTATWLLQDGVDVKTVAAILGHSSPVTTLTTYAHVMPGSEARAVEVIAKRHGRAKSGGS